MKAIGLDEQKKIELAILKELDIICKENNLKYYLAYGTLLGAVRHKGFIPWDDDIDVWMPREDYEKFLRICAGKTINDKYRVLSMHDKDYIYAFAKMVDIRTLVEEKWMLTNILGVYIDIFPLDILPINEKHRKRYINKLLLAHYGLLMSTRENKKRKTLLVSVLSRLAYYPLRIFGYRRWLNRVDKLSRKYQSNEKRYIGNVSIDSYIAKECYRAECFEDGVRLRFEDAEFAVPKNYEKILNTIYGDYMQLPPLEKRIKKHENKAYWKEN